MENDIDLDAQIVSVGNTKVDYDELVIGLGCEDKYHHTNITIRLSTRS
jgi:NADH dehydrogenase